MRKEFKFPTILGLIFLLIAIVAGVFVTKTRTTFGTKASGTCDPDRMVIANITNTSVDISFFTSSPCLVSLLVDDRPFSDFRQTPSMIHYFSITNLSQVTDYEYTIVSDGNQIFKEDYRFKTGSDPSSDIPTSKLAWGKVLNPDRKSPAIAIVYMNIPGASPLSSVVSSDGNWSVSLANSFNEARNDWFNLPKNPVDEEIIVISDSGIVTQVLNNSSVNNPVPDIIVGEDSLVPPAFQEQNSGMINSDITPIVQKNIDIQNPKDGDILSTSAPDFFGIGPINSQIIIEVHSDSIQNGEVTSSANGVWHWTPPSNLTPGEHTITAKVQNKTTGVWESISRKFIVNAADSDSGPQYVASPSATIITPTLEPTIILTNTPIPTTRVARPSTTVTPPVSGNTFPTVIIIVASLLFFLISVKFIK